MSRNPYQSPESLSRDDGAEVRQQFVSQTRGIGRVMFVVVCVFGSAGLGFLAGVSEYIGNPEAAFFLGGLITAAQCIAVGMRIINLGLPVRWCPCDGRAAGQFSDAVYLLCGAAEFRR